MNQEMVRERERLLGLLDVVQTLTEDDLVCIRAAAEGDTLHEFGWQALGEAFHVWNAARWLGGPWDEMCRAPMVLLAKELRDRFGCPLERTWEMDWIDGVEAWLEDKRSLTGPQGMA